MSVYKRKNGSWVVDIVLWREGKRVRVRKVGLARDRSEALKQEIELRKQLDLSKTFAAAKPPLFAAFAKTFMETYVSVNNKRSERSSKEMILRRHLIPAFGAKRLDTIHTRDIDIYKAEKLAAGLKPKTLNNHLTVLHRALSLAREWGLLSVLPSFRWLKAPRPAFDFLTFDEVTRLLAAAEPEWKEMILLAVRTGLRQGEILALRWAEVDLVAGRLIVQRSAYRGVVDTPKSGRSREVPLGDELVRALSAHPMRGELVFCTRGGSMLTKGECRRPLYRACERAGIRRIGWHVLRHTFASHLVMRGVPLKVVQELLGHATIEMTMRYSHVSPDVRRDAVRLLDRQPNV